MLPASEGSSLVWMCRFTSGRSFLMPEGNEDAAFVQAGNLFLARCCVVALLLQGSQQWLIEQPASSLAQELVCFQELAWKRTVYHVRTFMGAFGGPCPKLTTLWSNHTRVSVSFPS